MGGRGREEGCVEKVGEGWRGAYRRKGWVDGWVGREGDTRTTDRTNERRYQELGERMNGTTNERNAERANYLRTDR